MLLHLYRMWQIISDLRNFVKIKLVLPDVHMEPWSHGPRDVGCVLLGLHAQHGDAGWAPLKLRLGLEGVVTVGGRREEGVCAEEVVEGDVTELVLLVGEAHVAVVGGTGGRTRGVWVGSDAGRGASGQHAGGHHGAAGSRTRPQVVGNLLGERRF